MKNWWHEQMKSYPTRTILNKIATFSEIIGRYKMLLEKGLPDDISQIELENHINDLRGKVKFLAEIIEARQQNA